EDISVGLIAGALIDPTEHVGVGRYIMKQLAVLLSVRLLQGEKAAQIDRRFARGRWIPTRGMAVAHHVAVGILIIFAEGDADRHVQEMPDRAAVIDRRPKFGDVFEDAVSRIEQAAIGKDSAERAANRL